MTRPRLPHSSSRAARLAGTIMLLLSSAALPVIHAELPAVVSRYEEMLLRSPEKGTAFDKVYQYYFENEGLESLAQRWNAAATKEKSGIHALLLGMLYERQGKLQPALEAYTEATKLTPDNFRPWKALGEAEASQGKYANAISPLEKALKLARELNDRGPIYRSLAQAQQQLFKTTDALKTWRAMEKEFPEDPFVAQEIAEALAEAGDIDEAKATYERLRKLETSDPYQRLGATIALARLEERGRKIPEAIAIYEGALQEASAGSWIQRDIRSRIEEIYRRDENLPGLVAYYEKWLGEHGNDIEATVSLSRALGDLNRKKEAAEWMAKAVALAPDRRELQIEHARLLNATGEEEQAAKVLQLLTQAFPDETSYWELLGETEWLLFEKNKADARKAAALQAWSKLAPEGCKADAVTRLAILYRQHNLETEALAQYERVCTLEPDNADFKEQLAEYLITLQQEEKAWQILGSLVTDGNADKAVSYLRLATWQSRYKKVDEALATIAKGRALEPDNFGLLSLQWRLLTAAEKWDEAIALYEPMLAAAPSQYAAIEAQYIQLLTLSGKRAATLTSLAAKLGDASEQELRLLARLAAEADDVALAEQAVAEGHKRFPQSVPLAILEAEMANANRNIEGRIAVLRRLIGLDTRQTASALREIAAAYMANAQRDEALAAGKELLAAAPADADARLFYGNLCLDLQNIEEGIATLREAVKLSDKPNTIRKRLARVLIDNERLQEARLVYDEAFEAEKELQGRLNIMGEMTDLAVRQGTEDALIARFKEKQKAEEDGWRYALYLSEIFRKQGLFAEARMELVKALAQRPRDPALLKTLAALAENEGNRAEQSRFQELLIELDPSIENTRALVRTFILNNEPGKALALLQKNTEDFRKDPLPWLPLLLPLQEDEAVKTLLRETKQALERQPEAFRERLAFAGVMVALQDWESARQALGELRALPLPSITNNDEAASKEKPQSLKMAPLEVTPEKRIASANRARGEWQQFSELKQRISYDPYPRLPTSGNLSPIEVQDAALIYLASIAEETGNTKAFLDQLSQKHEAKKVPAFERVLQYQVLGSLPLLKQELQALLSHPEQISAKQATSLLNLVGSLKNLSTTTKEEAALYTKESATLKEKIEKAKPQDSKNTAAAGLKEKELPSDPKELAALLEATAQKPGNRQSDYRILFNKALSLKQYKLAYSVIGKFPTKGRSARVRTDAMNELLQNLVGQKEIELLSELLPSILQEAADLNRHANLNLRLTKEITPFSFETTLLPQNQMQHLEKILQNLRDKPELKKLTAALLTQKESPASVLAGAYLLWNAKQEKAAMKELSDFLIRQDHDEIRLVLGCMALEQKKPAEAMAALEGIPPKYLRSYQIALFMEAFASDGTEDPALREAARRAALQFVQLWPSFDGALPELLPQFSKLGLDEKRREITLRLARQGRGQHQQYLVQTLQEYRASNSAEAGRELAFALFRIPDKPTNSMEYTFHQAGSYLRDIGELDKIVTDLETKAEKAADPVPYYIRLLNLRHIGSRLRSNSQDLASKIMELRPNDKNLQKAVVSVLTSVGSENTLSLTRKIFKEDPFAILSDQNNFLYAYKNANAMEEYGSLVLQALEQRPSKTLLRDFANRSLNSLTSFLLNENKSELTLKILRKTVELAPVNDPNLLNSMRDQIIRTLLKTGEQEAALKEIETYFLPSSEPPMLWGLQESQEVSRAWISVSYSQNNVPVSTTPTYLEEIRKGGGLSAFREKVAAAAESHPSYQLLLVATDLSSDPKAARDRLLEIIKKEDPKMGLTDWNMASYLFALANECATRLTDPKEKVECLIALKPLFQKASHSQLPSFLTLQIVRVAIDAGEKKMAADSLLELVNDPKYARYSNSNSARINACDLLLELGLLKECANLIERLKQENEAKMPHSWLKQELQKRETQLASAQGTVESPIGVVTFDHEGDKPLLHWSISELDISNGYNYSLFSNTMGVTSFSMPRALNVDSRFDVELLFGTGRNAIERLAFLPKAKTSGAWNGKLPDKEGFIQTILHDKNGKRFMSSWIPYSSHKNLIENPTIKQDADGKFQGWELTSGVAYKGQGPGMHSGQTRSNFVNTTNNELEITGKRIPITPGKLYYASQWAYFDNHCRVLIKAYDANGKFLSSNELYGNSQSKAWNYRACHFSTAQRRISPMQILPANTAFVEPVLSLYNGETRVQVNYLGESDSPETAE